MGEEECEAALDKAREEVNNQVGEGTGGFEGPERERMGLKAQRGSGAFCTLFWKAGCVFRPVQRQETPLYKACMIFQFERQRSSLDTELLD